MVSIKVIISLNSLIEFSHDISNPYTHLATAKDNNLYTDINFEIKNESDEVIATGTYKKDNNENLLSGDDQYNFPSIGKYKIVYSAEDDAGNKATNYINVNVVNVPITFTLNMFDAWGDGWNGSLINISVNDNVVLYHATLATGAEGSKTFAAPPGDEVSYSFIEVGSWPDEITWNITDSDGNEKANGDVYSDGSFTA